MASYDALNKQRQRLQGRVNYWNNDARAWTQRAEKLPPGEARNNCLDTAAEYKAKADKAQIELNAIREQLKQMDPSGASTRQIRSAQANIARTKSEIRHIEDTLAKCGQDDKATDYWRKRLDDRRAKLTRLEQRIEQLRAAATPVRHQPPADTLAILDRIQKPIEEPQAQETSILDPKTVLTVIHGLKRNMIQAEERGNEPTANSLQAALQHLACMLNNSDVQTVIDGLLHAAALSIDSKVKNRLHRTISSIEALLDGNEPETLH